MLIAFAAETIQCFRCLDLGAPRPSFDRLAQIAPCPAEALGVAGSAQQGDGNAPAPAFGVDEAASGEVETDVPARPLALEEQHVPEAQPVRHGDADGALLHGDARKMDAEAAVEPKHEAGAVECVGAAGAPDIGLAEGPAHALEQSESGSQPPALLAGRGSGRLAGQGAGRQNKAKQDRDKACREGSAVRLAGERHAGTSIW